MCTVQHLRVCAERVCTRLRMRINQQTARRSCFCFFFASIECRLLHLLLLHGHNNNQHSSNCNDMSLFMRSLTTTVLMANIVIASGVYICTGRWSARATRCDSSAQSGFICLLLLFQYCAFFPLSVSFSSSLLMLAKIYESLISGDVCSPMMWDALSDCPGRNI